MGTFVSFPEAFPTADVRIVDGLKFQVKFHKSLSKENAIKFDAVFDASRMLLDFDAVDVSAINTETLIRDCEIVKDAISQHPKRFMEIVSTFANKNSSISEIIESFRVLKELGLSEDQITEKKGGFFFLIVALAILASGCAHCTQGGRYPPVKHP